uniref:Uncharacterized protein n=1 Tax=Equus asinus asinus TaxID=83772 RepID=A0A8C4PP14_EQUAS
LPGPQAHPDPTPHTFLRQSATRRGYGHPDLRRKKPAWDGERRPHDLGRLWGAGAILHRGSPGLSVGPVPLLVVSLLIAASVFMSHIWSKDIRPQPSVRRKNFNVSQTIREKTELKRCYWDS